MKTDKKIKNKHIKTIQPKHERSILIFLPINHQYVPYRHILEYIRIQKSAKLTQLTSYIDKYKKIVNTQKSAI